MEIEKILRSKGVDDRGLGEYRLSLLGERIARQSSSAEVLASNLRVQLSSHGISSVSAAQTVIHSAFESYAEIHGITDPDWVWYWSQFPVEEYKEKEWKAKRERILQIAKERQEDREHKEWLLRDRQKWEQRIRKLASENELDYTFVENFVFEHDRLSSPFGVDLPLKVDPRGVMGIQLTAPIAGSVDIIKDYIPFLGQGIAIYEAASGEGLISGRQLNNWERGLIGVLTLVPFAVRGVSRAGRAALRGVAAGTKTTLKQVIHSAKTLSALAVQHRIPPNEMLPFIKELSRIPVKDAHRLLARMRRARGSAGLKISRDEAAVLEQVQQSRDVLVGRSKATPKSSQKPPEMTSQSTGKPRHRAKVKGESTDGFEIPEHPIARRFSEGPPPHKLDRIRKRYPEVRRNATFEEAETEYRAIWYSQNRKSIRPNSIVAGETAAADLLGVPRGLNMVDHVATQRRGLLVPIEVKAESTITLAGKGNAAFNKFEMIAEHANMANISHFEVIARANSRLPPNFRVNRDGNLERLVDGQPWTLVEFGGRPVKVYRAPLSRGG
ncbi:pre-toxin TG domain-containing protein [Salinirubellus sp. GCM10025818]|uniref:pre-toxin TG domain-containing protein n=1 Tax=Salinirubellus TaxID=2162630 RepID=UPI0030CA66AF